MGELLCLRDSSVGFYGKAEGLAGDVVNSILLEENGDVWTDSMSHGLTHWRRHQRRGIGRRVRS